MKSDVRAQAIAPYLVALLLCLGYHVFLVTKVSAPPIETGELIGNDGYMRLIRVAELAQTWDWYDTTIARDNTPYGTPLHWTRPFDLVLLAGAKALEPALGFDRALYWWGVVITPLLHVLMVLCLVWAVRPLYGDMMRRGLLVLSVLLQPLLYGLAQAARPDHHTLVMVAFVLTVGFMLRLLGPRPDLRHGLAAGAAVGFGLWLTMEFLLGLLAVYASLAFLWLINREAITRRALWFCWGLIPVILASLVVERPPSALLEIEYDRISVVHLILALLGLGVWTLLEQLQRVGRSPASVVGRGALLACCGALAGVVLLVVFPEFLRGPSLATDPLVKSAYMDRIEELQPIWPTTWDQVPRALAFFGNAVIVVPYILYLLLRVGEEETWNGWAFVLIGVVIFLPIGLAIYRFGNYAEILLLIGLADLLGRLTIVLERVPNMILRVVCRAGAINAGLFGFVILKVAVADAASPESDNDAEAGQCDVPAIIESLNERGQAEDVPLRIMAHPDLGATLLYFTSHAVVGSSYHRNVDGIRDSLEFFLSEDEEQPREIVRRRGVDVVVVCEIYGPKLGVAEIEDQLFGRLLAGSPPPWLELAGPDQDQPANYKIYNVLQ